MAIKITEKQTISTGKHVEKFKPSYIAYRNIKRCYPQENSRQLFKYLNLDLTYDPAVTLESWKTCSHKNIV